MLNYNNFDQLIKQKLTKLTNFHKSKVNVDPIKSFIFGALMLEPDLWKGPRMAYKMRAPTKYQDEIFNCRT